MQGSPPLAARVMMLGTRMILQSCERSTCLLLYDSTGASQCPAPCPVNTHVPHTHKQRALTTFRTPCFSWPAAAKLPAMVSYWAFPVCCAWAHHCLSRAAPVSACLCRWVLAATACYALWLQQRLPGLHLRLVCCAGGEAAARARGRGAQAPARARLLQRAGRRRRELLCVHRGLARVGGSQQGLLARGCRCGALGPCGSHALSLGPRS